MPSDFIAFNFLRSNRTFVVAVTTYTEGHPQPMFCRSYSPRSCLKPQPFHRFLLASHAIVILLCPVQDVEAYVLQGSKWPQDNLGDPVDIPYAFTNFLNTGLLRPDGSSVPVSELRSGVEEVLQLWASVAPLNFREIDADSDVGIRFSHTYIDGFGGFKGYSYYPEVPTVQTMFDSADRWNTIGSSTYPDILGCALHEIGHALGLDHSSVSGAIMRSTFPRMSGPGTGYLTSDDVAGIQAIYGAGVGSVRPLIPEPCSLTLLLTGVLIGFKYARTKKAMSRAS